MTRVSALAPGLLFFYLGVIFRALACDYDGTLATADRIGPAALEALTRAREAGLKLILVTGRAFFELTRVCERLDLFDAVVAENGGVIYHPGSGAIYAQGPPPPMRLLAELDGRGIWYQLGHVVVGAARRDEDAVQDALDAAGVSRELIVNRSALMLLPAGISKGTGARQVIRDLGLSFHDVLALGDAENDDIFMLARTTDPRELAFLGERLSAAGVDGAAVAAALPGLPNGEFVLIQSGPDGRPSALSFVPTPRETVHVRHLAKYADARVGAGRRFVFRHPDGHEVASAESLTEFLRVVERVDPGVLDWHARRGDFSRWARGVFSDAELGRQLRKTENRWARGELAELAQSLARPIQARYGG